MENSPMPEDVTRGAYTAPTRRTPTAIEAGLRCPVDEGR